MQIFNLTNKKKKPLPLHKATVKDRPREGFTLVEVLIASAILLFTAGAFLSTLIQYSTLIATGFSEDIALSAAQAKLEEIAHSDLTQIMNYNNQNFTVSGLTAPVSQTNPGLVSVTQVAGTTDLFNIAVTVTWQQADRPISRTIMTTLALK